MACVTFDHRGIPTMNANSLQYLQRPGFAVHPISHAAGSILPSGAYVQAAGQALSSINVSGAQWLSWLKPQRLAAVRASFRPLAGETSAQYERRVSAISARITTDALAKGYTRAAGQAKTPNVPDSGSDPNNYGMGDVPTGTDNTGGRSGLTPAEVNAIATGAASVLGQTAQVIMAVINGNNQLERQRLADESAQRIAELRAQQSGSTDSAAGAAVAQQIQALQNTIDALQGHQGMSTNTMLLIGAGVLVLGAGAIIMMRPRHNPVIYKRMQTKTEKKLGKRGRMRPSHFVKASKLK